MQKQNGFTLVELVVVIIILGILAVTAAPKFINMQGDARVSTLQGVKGAINGANVMVYAKSSLQGQNDKSSGSVSLDGKNIVATENSSTQTTDKTNSSVLKAQKATASDSNVITTAFGYVAAKDVQKVADLQDSDWDVTVNGNSVTIRQKNAPTTCKLTYTQATDKDTLPSFSSMPKANEC